MLWTDLVSQFIYMNYSDNYYIVLTVKNYPTRFILLKDFDFRNKIVVNNFSINLS